MKQTVRVAVFIAFVLSTAWLGWQIRETCLPAPSSVAGPRDFSPCWRIDTESGSGSMVCIRADSADWIFLTAKHMVAEPSILNAQCWDGRQLQNGTVLAALAGHDLALVRFPPGLGSQSAVEFATVAPRLGDPVVVAGYPSPSVEFTVTEGRQGVGGQHSANASFGSSGSPVFDREGRLVGIVTQIWTGRTMMGDRYPVLWQGIHQEVTTLRTLLLQLASRLPASSPRR